jgi:hypothetical protein
VRNIGVHAVAPQREGTQNLKVIDRIRRDLWAETMLVPTPAKTSMRPQVAAETKLKDSFIGALGSVAREKHRSPPTIATYPELPTLIKTHSATHFSWIAYLHETVAQDQRFLRLRDDSREGTEISSPIVSRLS